MVSIGRRQAFGALIGGCCGAALGVTPRALAEPATKVILTVDTSDDFDVRIRQRTARQIDQWARSSDFKMKVERASALNTVRRQGRRGP